MALHRFGFDSLINWQRGMIWEIKGFGAEGGLRRGFPGLQPHDLPWERAFRTRPPSIFLPFSRYFLQASQAGADREHLAPVQTRRCRSARAPLFPANRFKRKQSQPAPRGTPADFACRAKTPFATASRPSYCKYNYIFIANIILELITRRLIFSAGVCNIWV